MDYFDMYCQLLDAGINDEMIMQEVLNSFTEEELCKLFLAIMAKYDLLEVR